MVKEMKIFKSLFIAGLIASAVQAKNAEPSDVSTQASAQTGERTLTPMHVDIKVSAAGVVTEIRPDPGIPASIRDLLVKAVNQWKFSPAKREGVPIDWATRVTVFLTAVPIEKGFALRVGKVFTASVWIPPKGMKHPSFPPREMFNGNSAKLALIVEPGIDGDPTVVRSVYVNGKPAANRDLFAQAAKTAAVKWKFEALQWDGVKYIEPACVPIEFLSTQASASRTQQASCKPPPEAWNNEFLSIQLESKPEGSTL